MIELYGKSEIETKELLENKTIEDLKMIMKMNRITIPKYRNVEKIKDYILDYLRKKQQDVFRHYGEN